jgi:hypothetical protein
MFAAMVQISNAVIEQSTVFVECVYDNGRKCITRYSHDNKHMAIAAAQGAVDRIDPYRSPSRGLPYLHNGKWAVDVTDWGL